MRKIFSFVILTYFLGQAAWTHDTEHERELSLARHRMNVAGLAALPMEYDRHGDFKLGLSLSPQFGYFVIDNLELRSTLNMNVNLVFGPQKRKIAAPINWDLAFTTLYYFKAPWHLRPYIGAGLGTGFMGVNIYSLKIIADFPLGTLIELHRNFAIDIGMPIRLHMSMRSLADRFIFPIGFIGFRYYFD